MPVKKTTKSTKGTKPRISETVDIAEDRVRVVTEVVEEPTDTAPPEETPIKEAEPSVQSEENEPVEEREPPVESDT